MNKNSVLAAAALTSVLAMASVSHGADIPKSSPEMTADDYGLVFAALGEFSAGYHWVSSNEDVDDDAPTVAASGRFSVPFGNMFSMQFDIDGELRFTTDEEDPQGVVMLGTHASVRDPSLGLIGVFGAVGQGLNEDPDDPEIGVMAGAEIQYYWNQITLYGQAGWADFRVDEGEGFTDGWFVRAVGRWFVNPDALVEAEVAYGETDRYIDGDDAGEFWNWGLKGKMKFNDMPVYGTLAYRGGSYDATTEGDSGTEHVALLGISILLGPNTLQDNDRMGATLDLPMLPGRAASWTEGLD
jgi:hypothetical protein